MLTKPLPGVMLNPQHPLSKGLVGCWLFNEGSGDIANDISGNKNHGALKNMLPNTQGTKWQGSKFGGGLVFDSTDDYIDISTISLADNTSYTVSMWIKPDVISTQGLYGNAYAAGEYTRFLFSTTQIRVYRDNNGLIGVWDEALSANVWQHIILVHDYSVTDFRLYIDGVDKGSYNTGTMDTPQTIKMIGGLGSTSSYLFDGIIDEVRIYNRALSAQEIKQLYYDPFCNLMTVPAWQNYVPSVGLSIPVAMHHYEMLRA